MPTHSEEYALVRLVHVTVGTVHVALTAVNVELGSA
jgi:hypothetical protein